MAKSVYYLGQLSMEEDADPCGSGCKGVVCSKTHSVTNLHLSSANLSWGIPTAIGGLQELISVDLLENPKLTSTIPRQIGQLRRLTHLKLSGCNFHGKVPEEIYNLNNLEYLDLSNNPQLLQCENAQDLITLPELQGPENTGRCHVLCLDRSAWCETECLPLLKTRAALCSRRQQSLTVSRRRLLHHRTLLQVNGRTPLPLFYTYIALAVVGLVIIVTFTFCFCRWLSVRRTRHADTYMMTPIAPSMPK
ncbi:uncharacterized protein [Physcomitrium patens]|uniref:uncharacterized protein isoform X1 n=1 Tax=Physcomitrium patens TaxID=3218 RepID=UPI000D178E54|nr:LRR receptor-like serine/threonine-protein kinase FLS2 isoform X1 [Physcomitrium patens]|eukprot:XP_024387890.1 LRR receptor-like serine/threonine-protein kinase FLS2 isoform X1 [Physcomitrella patens]